MKTTQFILFAALTCLLCASSCKETEPKVWTELPPITERGANTMGCLVDGKLWAASKLPSSTIFHAILATYKFYKEDSVALEFYAKGKEGSMAFYLENPKIGANKTYVGCSFNINSTCFVKAENVTGLYITKLDIENNILSGRFAFDVPCQEDATEILHITEGRFDLYLSVYK